MLDIAAHRRGILVAMEAFWQPQVIISGTTLDILQLEQIRESGISDK